MQCTFYGRMPVDAEIISPFVMVQIGEGISVGNLSAPSMDNEAVIKSFEYGTSNGLSVSIEILDEQGGAFDQSMAKMKTTLCEDQMIRIIWGWMRVDCATGQASPQIAGPIY